MTWIFQFIRVLITLGKVSVLVCLLIYNFSDSYLLVILMCIFLRTNTVRRVFICLSAIGISLFVKWLFKYFPYLIYNLYFVIVLWERFQSSEYKSLVGYIHCRYILLGYGLPFWFFSFLYFLLKENCFTEFCCFLSNLNMNQP